MSNCIKPNDFKPNGIKPSDHLRIFQPIAFEIQGGVGPATSTFLKSLCEKLCVCNQEKRRVVSQVETLSRNLGRQCGQCNWNSSGRRALRRTLLLECLRLMSVLFQQEIYVFFALYSLPFYVSQ